jgi:hypothetical protein
MIGASRLLKEVVSKRVTYKLPDKLSDIRNRMEAKNLAVNNVTMT